MGVGACLIYWTRWTESWISPPTYSLPASWLKPCVDFKEMDQLHGSVCLACSYSFAQMLLGLIGEEDSHFLPKRSNSLLAFFLEVQNLGCSLHWLTCDDLCKECPLGCARLIRQMTSPRNLCWLEWGRARGEEALQLAFPSWGLQ